MANATIGYVLHSGKNSKSGYYLGAGFRDCLPDALFRHRLKSELDRGRRIYDEDYIEDRVNYYCRFNEHRSLSPQATRIGDLRKRDSQSTYYYDSRDLLRWFSPDLRWDHLFGDQRDIPPYPSIVKTRSVQCDNSNSVLLKLNRIRHYIYLNDRKDFTQKQDRAVFRGFVGKRANRLLFCQSFADNPRVDLASTLTSGSIFTPEHSPDVTMNVSPRLSLYEHLDFRYIMALEGNDVASNLKWIMSSHSLAVMPKPTCESWFMEARLVPGVHYIEVKDDYSDLEAQMDYYSSHPAESLEMVRQANRYVAQFRAPRRERYIGLRVMEKYFKLTN